MTQPDWDDERLDAAFHARFDRPAPTDLAQDVHLRLTGTSPARFRMPRVGHRWSLAAAAVVVIFVGAATFGQSMLSLPGGPPTQPGASASASGGSATPSEQAIPGSVLGLPIVHVRDAIGIRDGGVDDREIAVQGWLTIAQPRNCGIVPPDLREISPVELRCPDDRTWLTEEREGTEVPTGPALNPMVLGLDMTTFDGATTPVDVVLIGHFDDRRADWCQDAEIPACRDRFVVDAVASVGGVEQPTSRLPMADSVSTDAEIEAIVANEAPDSPILSTTLVDPDGLASLEPSLRTGQQGLIDQRRLWIVRVLESERVVTYVVIDGSDAIYELNSEGDAILVGGEPPSPETTADPAAWPPAGARVIALTSEVGAGAPPVQVAVVDRSGRLGAVSEKGTVDPATISFDGRIGAYAEPGHPGRVHLTWVGGICDSQITVTVAEDLRAIGFDMGPQPACDAIGIGRQLVLDFTGSVDVPAIRLGEGTAVASAAPSAGLDPEVDCGPLGADACEARVAEIIAATPTKRVASIAFRDECGSYVATYEDGNGVSAIVDCIPGAEPT